jgi:D-3-phosphoglycerate dehydrogenase
MKVAITDYPFSSASREEGIFSAAGVNVSIARSIQSNDILAAAEGAGALLVNAAKVDRDLLASLHGCRVLVRYGIGVDNIDVEAATAHGIAVCNVPDYASGEVADHTMSLALALARQVNLVDRRVRDGRWRIFPDHPLPAFSDSRFVLMGYGRIAREVAKRARSFGFQIAAHDPFVAADELRAANVLPLTAEEALATADILSLHLPLTQQTRHLINATTLRTMKPTAILVNTSRGGLIEAADLAEALAANRIFAAGLDVFEPEPLPADSPLRSAPRVLLTSHVAWYSEASAPRLQTMAAQEVVRGLRGEPLRSQVNLSLCFVSTKK